MSEKIENSLTQLLNKVDIIPRALRVNKTNEKIKMSTKNLDPRVIYKLYCEEKKSLPVIAKSIGINTGTLWRWMKKHNIPTRSKSEAGALRKKLVISPDELKELYYEKKMSTKSIGMLYNVSGAAVSYIMKKWKMSTRTPAQIGVLKMKAPPYGEIYKMYTEEGKSTEKIAKILNVSPSSVRKWLKKANIPIRNRAEACRKYPRSSFSQDKLIKAYLLGFCIGDVYVRRRYQTIEVWTTTTHPAMIYLFSELFSKYGYVSKYPRKGTLGYEWGIRCGLDDSFSFLLEKYRRMIPEWIVQDEDENTFYSFLAGYADAEGYWGISKSHKDKINTIFELQSKDIKILKFIKSKLEKLNFHPTYGEKKGLCFLRICRRKEVVELAKKLLLYSKHLEKIEKIQFIINIEKEKSWKNILPQLTLLKNKIKNQVITFKEKAKKELKEVKDS
ncbi:MAG: sigma-70 region 4 domain-containing protein [Candidatus Aenigmatarchaeota archaeon]